MGFVYKEDLGMTLPDYPASSVYEGADKEAGVEDLRGMEAPPLLPLGGKTDKDKPPAAGEILQREFFRGTMCIFR
ncbi:hypothetical protein E4U56_005049 [Claviceps arundinis]|uniref:Uncharacterized protein n=1 Tax=Claviceps arundinis TaxID=1623583 RepID=A0A9P7MM29_9HYPO|nr:hypothetical protein E4U56_005049 [Claviceps arundinis]